MAAMRGDRWPRLVNGSSVLAEHETCVDAWVRRTTKNLPEDALMPLFQSALTGLWDRTKTTLGEVTLAAIAERVVHSASEKHPLLLLEVEPTGGIVCEGLREPGSASDDEVIAAIRFVLVEFLTVLGNLTAQILTPELHEELSKVIQPASKGEGKRP
jgi:hypothetical protein